MSPGPLWDRIVSRTAAAQRAGSLQPIPTRRESLPDPDTGVCFQLRVTDAQDRKEAEQAARSQDSAGPPSDPFAEPDPELWVADLTDTHFGLLNKFPVVDHHLLLVTRAYRPQHEPLDSDDCRALAAALAEIPGLGFFNAGAAAGASQGHKHLQLVPLPLAGDQEGLPLAPLMRAAHLGPQPGRVATLPFRHAALRLENLDGQALHSAYRALCRDLDLEPALEAYNLLVTSDWMLLVPRSQGQVDGIPLNALGYAGALMVRGVEQRAELLRQGPWWLLRAAGQPPD